MKQTNNKWKKIAITFIVLFVLETIMIITLANLGYDIEKKENECAINICEMDDRYEAYYYDSYEDICYCYINDEIVYSEYMK